MSLSASVLCLALSVILFGVATIGVPTGRFSLVAAGLFFLALSKLVT